MAPNQEDPNTTFGKMELNLKEFGLDLAHDCPVDDIDMNLEDPNFE